jgi:hypothetical protein
VSLEPEATRLYIILLSTIHNEQRSSPSPPKSFHSTMSPTCPMTKISSTSNIQLIFSSALKAYESRTKTDILAHPLAPQLQACTSSGSILAVLRDQVDDLARAQSSDERLTKWLKTTINVLLAFSATLGNGVSLVRPEVIPSCNYCIDNEHTGFLTRDSHLRRCWCPPPGLYLSRHLPATELDRKLQRRLRMLVRPKRL